MGLVYTKITLVNPRKENIKELKVKCLVDIGANMLCIPEHIALQLELETLENREITTADGKKQLCPYVGPVEIKFQNRVCFSGAIVIGDSVLLGSIPLEDMDLVIEPAKRRITVNPESPNIPTAIVK